MSAAAREALVARLVFQADSQRTDLLDESLTNSSLIAMLAALLDGGFHLEVTAVRSDHHDDGTGPGLHYGGLAIDCWPLHDGTPGNYLDASDLPAFLAAIAKGPYYYDTGLGGSSFTPANMAAAGASAFEDAPVDHVHIGVSPA